MEAATFWNEVGSTKTFEDPFYVDKLTPFLSKDAHIVEYGCGYGRILQQLFSLGYQRLAGFDFAAKMIERGRAAYPHLSLNHLSESGVIPLEDASVDALALSTVLCCIPDRDEQRKLMEEVHRLLKPAGALYLTDFLISSKWQEKYRRGRKIHGEWGVYTTSEGVAVRHHSTRWIFQLLEKFDVQWFEQFEFKTMNGNPVRTFHCVAQLG